MSISKILNINSLLKNKILLKNLGRISEHGMSFTAGTSFAMAGVFRPVVISATPKTDRENKQYAMANSIGSALMKFAIVESFAIPVELAIKNIDKNPAKFLAPSSILNLNQRSYRMLTQCLKQSVGFVTAIPKSLLTVALIPVIMDKLFFKHKVNKSVESEFVNPIRSWQSFNFTGKMVESASKKVAKIIDNKKLQQFALKYQTHDKDIPKHITASTDVLLTSSAIYATSKSKKIKQNRKRALILNNALSTVVTLGLGYGFDGLVKFFTSGLVDKFKRVNQSDPNLYKYLEGLNILRPALIFAGIYYLILPIFSTYVSDKIDKYMTKHERLK